MYGGGNSKVTENAAAVSWGRSAGYFGWWWGMKGSNRLHVNIRLIFPLLPVMLAETSGDRPRRTPASALERHVTASSRSVKVPFLKRDSLKGEEKYGARCLADARFHCTQTRCHYFFQDGFWWRGWEMDGAIVNIVMGAEPCGVRGRGL